MVIIGWAMGGLLCLLAFLAVAWLSSNRRLQRSGLLPLVLAGGAAFLLLAGSRCVWDADMEWNPVIRDAGSLPGTWQKGSETFVLRPDHTFIYRTSSNTISGNWTLEDWNLDLKSEGYHGLMRFVQFRGQYRLMSHPPDDPDAWDGDPGLEKVAR